MKQKPEKNTHIAENEAKKQSKKKKGMPLRLRKGNTCDKTATRQRIKHIALFQISVNALAVG